LHNQFYIEYSVAKYIQENSFEDGGYGYTQEDEFYKQYLEFSKILNGIYIKPKYFKVGDISDGERNIYSLLRILTLCDSGAPIYRKSHHGYTSGLLYNKKLVMLLDEPENYLHPIWAKKIPQILSEFCDLYGVQFIITTHSPFIISEAGEIAEKEFEEGKEITQKVYMIEDGKCLNPEGSSGKDVKGIAATILGAGIEDLTPSTVVFCAETEADFLEAINTKFYFRDIKFLTPFNGNDETIRKLEILTDAGMFNDTFYKGAKFWYYLDHPNEHQLKSKRYQDLKEKAENQANLILSDKEMFELKFTDDIQKAKEWHKQAKDFAKEKAEGFINMGASGKAEFESLFGELWELFGFPEPKK
jgi:hypothetical protein